MKNNKAVTIVHLSDMKPFPTHDLNRENNYNCCIYGKSGEGKTVLSENYNLKMVVANDDLIISTPLLPHHIICHLAYIELMQYAEPDTYARYKILMQKIERDGNDEIV